MPPDNPILIASDNASDADLVAKLLAGEFGNISVSIQSDRSVEDFEEHRPAVLVLAFRAVESAEHYYLELCRACITLHAMSVRTIILCGKDDTPRVYALCRQEYFDDYVVFWTWTLDAPRLPMAVHQALRKRAPDEACMPTAGDVAAQARPLAGVGSGT